MTNKRSYCLFIIIVFCLLVIGDYLICFSLKMGKKSRVKTQKSGTGATATVSPKEMLNLISELLQSKFCFCALWGKRMVCGPIKKHFFVEASEFYLFPSSGQACYFSLHKIVLYVFCSIYLYWYIPLLAFLYVYILNIPYFWQLLTLYLNTSINTG